MKYYFTQTEASTLFQKNDFGRYLAFSLSESNIDLQQIIKINAFTTAITNEEWEKANFAFKQNLEFIFDNGCPAHCLVAQPSTIDSLINIEIIYMDDLSQSSIFHKQYQEHCYTLVQKDDEKILFSGGITFPSSDQFLLSVQKAFDFAEQLLDHEKMGFSNIVRQWNYIENLLGYEKQANQQLQRYQIFNEVRSFYYDPAIFKHGFPAATGIGCESAGITIDYIAGSNLTTSPIKSPIQQDAYKYTENVLEGDPLNTTNKRPPFFERALYSTILDQDTIFISGTAAIAGEETLESADISDQTTHTIDNIKALITQTNFQANGIKGEAHHIFDMVRVYIKNEMDANVVEQLVKELLPADNYTFVLADVCRDNLLVEIEGIVSLNS
ncbi:MAG: hypothetical protein JEZ14_04170 [Marinilabiliaceae bacterium]|nr:hypothetical protein [Marinilabiliaceae bacterium]